MPDDNAQPELVVARMFHNVVIATPQRGSLWDRIQIYQVLHKLNDYLDAKRPPAMILDLEQVEKISSEAIGALLRIRDHATGNGCQLRLCNLRPPVYEVLRITELTRLFDIYEDLPKAYRGLMPEDPS